MNKFTFIWMMKRFRYLVTKLDLSKSEIVFLQACFSLILDFISFKYNRDVKNWISILDELYKENSDGRK